MLINSHDIKNVKEIQETLKNSLEETLQDKLEAETNKPLDYGKNDRYTSENNRNGFKIKKIRSAIG
ncbi:hypothetical protein [Peptostreptococcus faecalis]|uniref:hypothetical protein n=1 Tax=Peptostreptococcus faecalis TaxID=2045015 RepID=UPI000C7DBC59|nr:hypothetical protein [Peptostreptococcus faecalis]